MLRSPARAIEARAVTGVLFTIGYERSSLADVVAALGDTGVTTLVDVREAPWSRRPEFTKRALGEAMAAAGIGYRHMKALGTPKAGRDAARAGDTAGFHAIFEAHLATEAARAQLGEVAALVATERPCLMCYERDPDRCHRSIVAARLAETTGLAVRHLVIPRGDDSQLVLL